MNVPVNHPLMASETSRSLRAAVLDDATVVALTPQITAVFFDRTGGQSRARLTARLDGQPVPKPFMTGSFDLRSGGLRHTLLVARGMEELLARPLRLHLNDNPAAGLDPGWLQLPVGDLAALIEGMSEAGRQKLLRLLLTTGASLFSAAGDDLLAEAMRRIMAICDVTPVAPVAATGFGGHTVLTWPLPAPVRIAEVVDPVILTTGQRLLLARKVAVTQEIISSGALLHVHLPQGIAMAEMVMFGDRPLRLAAPEAGLRRLPAPVWLAGRSAPARDWLLERIALAATTDKGAASTMRELRAGAVEPGLNVLHLSATPRGMLYAVELKDPAHLIRGLILERGEQRCEIAAPPDLMKSAIIADVAPLAGRADSTETARLRLLYHSGRLRDIASLPLPAWDGVPPAEFATVWREAEDGSALLAGLARARLDVQREPARVSVRRYGALTQPAALRIVTGIGASVDMIRARAAMILAEKGARRVEVICAMTEGPLAPAARRMVEEVVAVYGIPHCIVSVPEGTRRTERLAAALAQAGDAPALVLGPDVLPVQAGWLAWWQRRLAGARDDIVGSVLMATDGSVAAATNVADDPFRGLPARCLPASMKGVSRPAPHCFGLTVAGVQRLRDGSLTCPDLTVMLAQAIGPAGVPVETRQAFVRYAPAGAAPDPFIRSLSQATLCLIEANRK